MENRILEFEEINTREFRHVYDESARKWNIEQRRGKKRSVN